MADDVVTRIDAHRARRIGEMLVTASADEQFQAEPRQVLMDLAPLDGRDLLKRHRAKEARYATAPFDPSGNMLRFFPGGVTIWSGYPGSGKTTLLRQFVCHTLARGSSVFLASLEEDPEDVLVRLAATAAGRSEPNAHQVQWFIDAYQKRFRLWGIIGLASHLEILGTVRKLASEGIRHMVIDSLMCMDVRNDDFEAQRKFANLISATARAARVHIHLVAHPRKLVSANAPLDLNDVAGAREIGGIADNVIFIRRDPDRASYAANADVTPMCVSIKKQRHWNGYLGECEGWFHRAYRQFHVEQFPISPARYLPEDALDPTFPETL